MNAVLENASDGLDLSFTDADITLMGEVVAVLSPFAAVTAELQSEHTISISDVYPAVISLLEHCRIQARKNTIIAEFCAKLTQQLHDRFMIDADLSAKQVWMWQSALLHPALRSLHFLPASLSARYIDSMHTAFIAETATVAVAVQSTPPDTTTTAIAATPALNAHFYRNWYKVNAVDPPSQREDELKRYLGLPSTTDMADPLTWWSVNAVQFPELAKMARRYFSIPATTAPSERVWSVANARIGKHATRTLPSRVCRWIMLKHNLKQKAVRAMLDAAEIVVSME